MSNKRTLKKEIRYVCGDIAAQCSMLMHLVEGVDTKKMDDVIVNLARLQQASLARVNVTFDKVPHDFENKHAYDAAKSKYFAEAFAALRRDFNTHLADIVKEMNAAMPPKKECKAE